MSIAAPFVPPLALPPALPGTEPGVNVAGSERLVSALAGGTLLGLGLSRRGPGGALLAVVGGALVWRGATGRCPIYRSAGIDTARGLSPGIEVKESVSIERPADELYRFWRELTTLPRFMKHLVSVERVPDGDGTGGPGRTRWTAKGPAKSTVTWDAEITEDIANELLAWRSLPGSGVQNRGIVRFRPASGGRGAVVAVDLRYDPPAGPLGAAVARLFGEEPRLQVREDLRRFRQLMETGEIATTEGQSSGREAAR